jgi:hypothetical protein
VTNIFYGLLKCGVCALLGEAVGWAVPVPRRNVRSIWNASRSIVELDQSPSGVHTSSTPNHDPAIAFRLPL